MTAVPSVRVGPGARAAAVCGEAAPPRAVKPHSCSGLPARAPDRAGRSDSHRRRTPWPPRAAGRNALGPQSDGWRERSPLSLLQQMTTSARTSATVADSGHGIRPPRIENSWPHRGQCAGDASSPDPGDSAAVSRHYPLNAAIDTLFPWTVRVSEWLLAQYPALAARDGPAWVPGEGRTTSHSPINRRVPAQPKEPVRGSGRSSQRRDRPRAR
jgi:hypothetical protein